MLDTIAVSVGSILFGHVFFVVITRVLPRLFPYRPAPGQTRWNLEQLKRLYGRVDARLIYFWGFGGFIIPSLAWYLIFKVLTVIVYPDPGPRGMIMTPDAFYWGCIAFLAGPVTLYAARHAILKRILKHRYLEYRLYRKWKSGRAVPLLTNIGITGIGLMLVVATYLLATTYTAFMPTRMVIARNFRPAQVYGYDDIVELRAVTREKSSETKKLQSWYEIEFYDGTIWHARRAHRSAVPCGTYPFIAFAAEKSRKEITGPDIYAESGCP